MGKTLYGLAGFVCAAAMLICPARLASQDDQADRPGRDIQAEHFRAIIPVFHDRLGRPGSESPLRLRKQTFIIFVFRNAVAVYAEAEFVNTGEDSIRQEFALPSTGHDRDSETDSGMVSNGILSPRVWIEGERVEAEVVEDGDGEWYRIMATLQPGDTRGLAALFWAQTSLANIDSLPGLDSTEIEPGPRGFLVDIAHAGVWNDVIDSVGVTAVLKGGLSFDADSFAVSPENYDRTDSTLEWSYESLEPATDDDIVFDYRPSGKWPAATNTMARLSAYIVSTAYDRLLEYVTQLRED